MVSAPQAIHVAPSLRSPLWLLGVTFVCAACGRSGLLVGRNCVGQQGHGAGASSCEAIEAGVGDRGMPDAQGPSVSQDAASGSKRDVGEEPAASARDAADRDAVAPGSVLDGAEMSACPVHQGDVEVRDAADVAKLAVVCEVIGDIRVADTELEILSLPRLQRVAGDVTVINNTQLARVDLPALVTVEGDLYIGQQEYEQPRCLVHLSLPQLQRVAGDLVLLNNAVLPRVELPQLEEVEGALWVLDRRRSAASELVSLRLPRLRRVGAEIDITNHSSLSEIDLSSLTEVNGGLTVGSSAWGRHGEFSSYPNPLLERLLLPLLEVVGGVFQVHVSERLVVLEAPLLRRLGGMSLERNPALVQLELPELGQSEGFLSILDNPVLERVALPALVASGGLQIANNPLLEHVALPVLVESGPLEVENNPELSSLSIAALQLAEGLYVEGNGLAGIALPQLTHVADTLEVSLSGGPVELPQLMAVGGLMSVSDVSSVACPVLANIGLWLHARTAVLGELTFPSLTGVGGDISLAGSGLSEFSLPALTQVDAELSIHDNPVLQQVSLPALSSIGSSPLSFDSASNGLELYANPVLKGLDLSGLRSVAGNCSITGSPQLVSCSFTDVAVGGTLDIPAVCQ